MYVQQDVTVEADWDNLLKTVIGTYGLRKFTGAMMMQPDGGLFIA